MTPPDTATASPSSDRSVGRRDGAPVRPDRLTVSAAIALLTISALHTVVFALHPWWGAWMAGPFRTAQLPVEAAVQFWGLPGGFVVPGVLLALLVLRVGRRGDTVPLYIALTLGIWALVCIWMVGPSGFVLLLVPVVLLLIAALRARRRAEHRG
ncbi:hypothetical protein [Microbacterium sp. AK031]|uniref:hypothetical protein n=1 Tax=Microbacterium sp. AK031 TaxID=2723076 RepID=UPI002168FEB8|nr:hypothetical protein [Microbacterium sp. AK031]MCS3844363.1 hypothetical protein [Microbacterium sp. AK031]